MRESENNEQIAELHNSVLTLYRGCLANLTTFLRTAPFKIKHSWMIPCQFPLQSSKNKLQIPLPLGLVDEEFDQLSNASVRSLLEETPDKTAAHYRSLNNFDLEKYEDEGNHGHRIKGYFLAKETGKFRFFSTCSNGCRLYLGKDDSCTRRSLLFDYKNGTKQDEKR